MAIQLNIPRKCGEILWDRSNRRYRVLYGGRGSAKSWSVARYLITRASNEKLRIICTREIQNSIKDSVYRLLTDQINEMGLGAYFTVKSDSIQSVAGSEFLFKGLQKNINEIKSTEGIDICWVEEAERVIENSWVNLVPTVRKEGSFFIIVFNPEDERSATYTRFIENDRIKVENPDIISQRVNWWDNAHFPAVLRKEMEWDKKNDTEKYEHVWGGKPKKYGNAVIFKNKIQVEDFEAPEDVQFFYGADFGYANDPSCLVRMFIQERKLYIDYEAYGVGVEIDDLHAFFKTVPDSNKWKITADSARPETISHLSRDTRDGLHEGYKIEGAEKGKGSVEDGIEFLKNFEAIIIHPRCTGAIDNFRNYRWKTDRVTGEILPIPLDKSNHVCFDGETKILMGNNTEKIIKDVNVGDLVITNQGKKTVLSACMTAHNAKVNKYTFSNGKELIATPDHPIYTKRGKLPIDAVRYDDIIEVWKTSSLMTKYIDGMVSIMSQVVDVLKVAKDFTLQYGNFIWGSKFLKGITSIIKTRTLKTTNFLISNVLQLKSICQIMQKRICKTLNTENGNWHRWRKSDHSQKRGTNQEKGIYGIKTMLLKFTETNKKKTINVFNVLDSSETRQSLSSVQTRASQNGEEKTDSTILKRIVSSATKCLSQINIARYQRVHLVAVQNLSQRIDVYNLTVEDAHNYYANRILVSNCDAARYALESWIKEQEVCWADVL